MDNPETRRTRRSSVSGSRNPAPDSSTGIRIVSNHAKLPAVLAAIGFLLLAGYQVALALGMHLAGWGGGPRTLPTSLRIGSAVSAVVFVVAALVILGRAGLWRASVPSGLFRWGAWVLVVIMSLSALANFASPSNGERFLLGPLAIVLALLCLLVARSPVSAGRRGSRSVRSVNHGVPL